LAGYGATVTSPPAPPVPAQLTYLFPQTIVIDDPPPEPLTATSTPVFGGMPSSSALLPPKAAAKPPPPDPMVTEYPRHGDHIVLWQCRTDFGWIDYEPDFGCRLERHFQSANPDDWVFQFRPGQAVLFEYSVNFPLWQRNTETRRKRQMRRVFQAAEEHERVEAERVAMKAENEAHHSLTACYARRNRPSRSASRSRSQARR